MFVSEKILFKFHFIKSKLKQKKTAKKKNKTKQTIKTKQNKQEKITTYRKTGTTSACPF